MRLAWRDRWILRRAGIKSMVPDLYEQQVRRDPRALAYARLGAEHAIWTSRLLEGERAAAAECERLEARFRTMLLEDGMEPEEAEASCAEMRRRRVAPNLRVSFR